MDRKCQKCGNNLKENEEFCTKCGEKNEQKVKTESSKEKNIDKKLIAICVGVCIIGVCVMCISKQKLENLTASMASNLRENVVETKNIIVEKNKTLEELNPVIPCESSYTGMSFGIMWEDLRNKIDEYLKESYKNMPNITISQWNQNVNTNGTIIYTSLLKKDNKTFSDVSVEVDAVSQRPTMFSVSFIQSDPTLEPYASSEQKNNLKQIAKMLRVDKEYSDFLLNVEQNTGDAESFENNIFSYYYNTVDFCGTYVMATTEEKKNEIIDSWYAEEEW